MVLLFKKKHNEYAKKSFINLKAVWLSMMVRCILLWFGLVLTSLSFVISDMQKFATRNLISSFYTIKVFNIKMLGSIKIIIHFQNVLISKTLTSYYRHLLYK